MRGLVDQRAGDGDALALAAGEIGAALLDDRVVALRQLGDELVGAGEPRRLHHQRARRGGIGQRDVLVDRAVEQHVLLQHDADLAAQPGGIELGDVDAVEQHLAGVRAVEALDRLGQRRLAGTRSADDADHFARRDRQRDVAQRVGRIGAVAQR